MRSLISVLLLFLLCHQCFSQIVFKSVESHATQDLFVRFKDFLIEHPTDTVNIDAKTRHPDSWSFYDSVINRFFDRNRMLSEFRNAKNSYDPASLRQIQYQILYGIDKSIDRIPHDSIFVMGAAEYFKLKKQENNLGLTSIQDRFLAGFLINADTYPVLDIGIDVRNNLFIMMMPIIYFDKKDGEILKNFLERYISAAYKSEVSKE